MVRAQQIRRRMLGRRIFYGEQGDQATQCMLDTAHPVDGPAAEREFA